MSKTNSDPLHQPEYILLYDGFCGFCNTAVRIILRFDKKKTMRFAALQNGFAKAFIDRHPSLQKIDSLILIGNYGTVHEVVLIKSAGALMIAEYLGGMWKILIPLKIVPTIISDWLYDAVVKYRYTLFGKYDTCILPTSDVRSRFLD